MAHPLRDRTLLTRLLILREFVSRPDAPLRDVAKALGVTPQAVSGHVAALSRDGLVAEGSGRRVVTPSGVQALQEGLRSVKRAVDEALEPLAVVDVTSAIAKTRIRRGEAVGLFMEDGELVARAGRTSASVGRAVDAAEPDDEVLVRDLAGVVELRPGRLWVVRLPGPEEGGSRAVNGRRLQSQLAARSVAPARVGAVGAGAKVVVGRLGLRLDFSFAAARATFHAAELGLDVALFVTRDLVKDTLDILDAANAATLRRVPIEIVEAPVEDLKRKR
ncbi:MAG: DUF7839 domain-containing protein [Methanobacteriota archaeon]